ERRREAAGELLTAMLGKPRRWRARLRRAALLPREVAALDLGGERVATAGRHDGAAGRSNQLRRLGRGIEQGEHGPPGLEIFVQLARHHRRKVTRLPVQERRRTTLLRP